MAHKNFIDLETLQLTEIAITMIDASRIHQNNITSIKMTCLLDKLLNMYFNNSISIIVNSFEYINNSALDYQEDFDLSKLFEHIKNENLDIKSDCYRTFGFLLYEIIILINDSINNGKITESFFRNFTLSFSKLFLFENKFLDTKLTLKTLEMLLSKQKNKN